jgi:hypothetical protein
MLWKKSASFYNPKCLRFSPPQNVVMNTLHHPNIQMWSGGARQYATEFLPGKKTSRRNKILITLAIVFVGGLFVFGRTFIKVFLYTIGISLGVIVLTTGILFLSRYRKFAAARRLYSDIVSALQLNRKEIENVIGDFEIPSFRDMLWFTSYVKNPNGAPREALNYAFGIEGSVGRAIGAAQGFQVANGTWELVTFKIDLHQHDSMVVTQRVLVQKDIQQTTIDTNPVTDSESTPSSSGQDTPSSSTSGTTAHPEEDKNKTA